MFLTIALICTFEPHHVHKVAFAADVRWPTRSAVMSRALRTSPPATASAMSVDGSSIGSGGLGSAGAVGSSISRVVRAGRDLRLLGRPPIFASAAAAAESQLDGQQQEERRGERGAAGGGDGAPAIVIVSRRRSRRDDITRSLVTAA